MWISGVMQGDEPDELAIELPQINAVERTAIAFAIGSVNNRAIAMATERVPRDGPPA